MDQPQSQQQQPMYQQERDLVLPPNTFAFVLDSTKGKLGSYVGPIKQSLSNTDMLVTFRNGKFPKTEMDGAIQSFVEAKEGQYIVLNNPAHGGEESDLQFPKSGTMNDATDLDTGRKVVIPGPANFSLWPGQSAQVIDGHHLRHNQYLVVRVYESEAAAKHAGSALVAPQTSTDGEGSTSALDTRDFTMGQLIVIKGSDVSFYMPSTGIEVVPESPNGHQFVRDAATLEQLEYCVLLDESGRKRFEQGPAVVFPKPTETFATDPENKRKFKAIELNPQSGLYIKVIASYQEEDGTSHREGDELFLTGNHTPIYFPREEHSIIQYGDKRKHHAIAIPEGEGRYVLERTKGEVTLAKGPKMFLPDPRTEVIVRRILDPSIVEVMYPGNDEALSVNQVYREEQQAQARAAGGLAEVSNFLAMEHAAEQQYRSAALLSGATPSTAFGGEKMRRGTEYTPPRMITLDTKYEGAVTVSVWPGYAVLVMDKSGNRRVEVGPINILLEYDESLMVLSLSTGRPKSDRSKLRTPYLRTINNSISDQMVVETKDLVPVSLTLAYRVNFEGGDSTHWFDVEDYVALLTDHCRSKLRNLAKRHNIQEFYTETIDLIRDDLLGASDGESRPGLSFIENNMVLYDVEVLGVRIEHPSVEQLLAGAQDQALRGAIQLSQAEQETERDKELQRLERVRIEEREKTSAAEATAMIANIMRNMEALIEEEKVTAHRRAEMKLDIDQELELIRERDAVELDRLKVEVDQMVRRMAAIDSALIQAISQLGDQTFVEKVVEAIGPVAMATGVTTADTFQQVFKGTPFEGMFAALAQRPYALVNGHETHDDE